MRRGTFLLMALFVGGCGGVKNTNPLLGLAGPSDSSRYGFESSTQGWFRTAAGPVDNIFHAGQVAFFGAGGLGVHVSGLNKDASGTAWIGVSFTAQPSLTAKTLRFFVYAPAAIAPSDSAPSYAQVYLKDGAGKFANSAGINLGREAWTEVSWAPYANPGALINAGGPYIEAGFDPSAVAELGLKVAAAGTSGSFSFTGSFYVDSVDW